MLEDAHHLEHIPCTEKPGLSREKKELLRKSHTEIEVQAMLIFGLCFHFSRCYQSLSDIQQAEFERQTISKGLDSRSSI
jgi:hypothetical protein